VEDKNTKKEDAAIKAISSCIDFTAQYYQDRLDCYRRYEGVREERKTDTRDQESDHVYISHEPAKLTEQLVSFYTQALLNENNEKVFDIAPYNNVEAAAQAEAVALLLNYYLSNMNTHEILRSTLFESVLLGTGILEVCHKKIYITEIDNSKPEFISAFDETGKLTQKPNNREVQKEWLSQPFLQHISLNNFFVDSTATSMNDLQIACVREIMNYKDVEAMKDAYGFKNLAKAKESEIPARTKMNGYWNYNGTRKRIGTYDIDTLLDYNKKDLNKKNPKVELIKIYRPGTVQFVLNNVVISDEVSIYPGVRFPFVIFKNDPKPREFFGRSSIELIKRDIEFHEELIELMHKSYLLHLKPTIFADVGVMNKEAIELYKNGKGGEMISVPLGNSPILEVRGEAPQSSAFDFANNYVKNAKEALSINPLMEGSGQDLGSGVRTEGSFELLSRIGSTRLQSQLAMFVKNFEDVGRILLQIAKIFADKMVYITSTGVLGDTVERFIDPASVDTRIKFKVTLGSIADPSKASKTMQRIQLLDTISKLDKFQIFRSEKALAETAIKAGLFEDPVGLWETDPEVIQNKAQYAASLAGVDKAVVSGLPSPSMMQQSMQEGQEGQEPPQPEEPQPTPQASSLPRPNEGV
jgi:hypothetical protein